MLFFNLFVNAFNVYEQGISIQIENLKSEKNQFLPTTLKRDAGVIIFTLEVIFR